MIITLEQGTQQWEQAVVHQETRGRKGNLESSKEMSCGERYEVSSCRLKLQAWKLGCRSVSQCLRKRTWLGAKKAGAHSQDLARSPGSGTQQCPSVFISSYPRPQDRAWWRLSFWLPVLHVWEFRKICNLLEKRIACLFHLPHDWAVISLPLKRQNHNFLWFKCSPFL